MTRTQYYTATSLDGYLADEHNSLDWLFQFGEPGDDYPAFIAAVGALAMGSTTYEWLLDHMRTESGELQPWPYAQPTWVFTTRELPRIPDADIRFVRGDVRPVHAEMTRVADGKNIWVVGGGDLVGQFHDHGLLDELIITVAPVTLGRGAPLLPRRVVTPPFKLVAAGPYSGDLVQLRYEVVKG